MKKLKEIFGSSICITSRKTVLLIIVVLLSTLVLASVWSVEGEEVKVIQPTIEEKTRNVDSYRRGHSIPR